jgi:AcrR family transcriptional regulator
MTTLIEQKRPPSAEEANGRRASPPIGLTVRQRRLRAELVREAMELFGQKGFEGTSLSDIVQVVGISLRTFFRYFRTKEDLAFGWLEEQGQAIADMLSAQAKNCSPISALQSVLLEMARRRDVDHASSKALIRVIFDSPALTGRFHAHVSAWEERCIQILRRAEAPGRSGHFRLRVQVAAVDAAYGAALKAWAADEHVSFHAQLTASFAALTTLGKQVNPRTTATSHRKR